MKSASRIQFPSILALLGAGLLLCTAASAADDTVQQNEKSAAQACLAYCRAQEIYRRTDFDRDHMLEYAQVLHGGRKPSAPLDLNALPKASAEELKMIAQFIAKLGSDQYLLRERASLDLEAMGVRALAQLKQAALADSDPEVMQRAGKLSEKIVQSLTPALNTNTMYGLFSSGREGFVDGDIRLVEKDFASAECAIGADPKTVTPKDGYLFRVLTGQGASAVGGVRKYIAHGGNMTLGYGLLAFPKEYGSTGKKVFIINNQQQLWVRDFGSREATDAFAKDCTEFNPVPGWAPAR